MLQKIILAGVTASVIAASTLAAMTTTAAAAPGNQPRYNDNGPNVNQMAGGDWRQDGRYDGCRPIVRGVRWFDWRGQPHWRRIVVDNRCDFRGPGQYPRWHGQPDWR
jgi:hypothetical protein